MHTTNFICRYAPCLQKLEAEAHYHSIWHSVTHFLSIGHAAVDVSQFWSEPVIFCLVVVLPMGKYASNLLPFYSSLNCAFMLWRSDPNTTNPPHSRVKSLLLLFYFVNILIPLSRSHCLVTNHINILVFKSPQICL